MNSKTLQSLIGLLCVGLTSQAHGGGLYLYELGTEDLGLAGAGSAARAQDASTVATNPAGMTHLDGSQLVVGAQMLYGDLEYSLDDPNLKGPGNVVGWLPGLSTFYSHSVSDDLKVGAALYSNFGLSLGFDGDWAGRTLVKDSTLLGVVLQPALAYRINHAWSVGAGLGVNLGIFSLTRDSLVSGDEKSLDDTDVAYNGRLSLLFTPTDQTRFGLTYTGKVDYQFDVNASGNLPSGASWELPISAFVGAPQQVMFSAVQVLNEKWSLLGNIGWQDWSTFNELAITAGNVQLSSSLDLQDTWHGAMGTQCQMTVDTRLNFGVAYDTSMYENQDDTSLTLPTGAAWRFGTGIQHRLNDTSSIGAAFEFLSVEDARVVSPAVLSGNYNDPRMYFFSVNYNYLF
ncbi:MAG: outer membrane protein transport protein [Desulforhopalus sp.]